MAKAMRNRSVPLADSDVRSQSQQDSQARDRMAGESPAPFTRSVERQMEPGSLPTKVVQGGRRSVVPAVGLGLLGIWSLGYFALKRRRRLAA